MAPARNVSLAAITLESPWSRSQPASFAMVVVFPVPFTPTNRITYGFGVRWRTVFARSIGGRARIVRQDRSRQARIASSASTPKRSFFPARSLRRSRRNRSMTGTATSDSRRTISRSSSTSSIVPSFSRRPRNPSVKIVASPPAGEAPGVPVAGEGAGVEGEGVAFGAGPEGVASRDGSGGTGDASSERLSRALIAAHIGRRAALPRDRVESLRERLDPFVERGHLAFDVPERLFDADGPVREELDDLRPLHLGDDPGTHSDEHRRVSVHRPPHERLAPEGKQHLGARGRAVHAFEALASANVVLAGGAQDLVLLKEGRELVAVRVEAQEVLLDLLLGHLGGARAHPATTSAIELIRM